MDKNTAKKTLIFTLALFFTTLIISIAIVFSITFTGNSSLDLSNGGLMLLSICTAILPTGSFVGFVAVFSRIKEISKALIFALCIVFPITLCAITIYGILSIIPVIIKCIAILVKK